MATDVVVAYSDKLYADLSEDEIKVELKKWRTWFYKNWDIDPTDTQAF